MTHLSDVLGRIDAARLADDLWRLVGITSPTGQEREIAFVYSDMLRAAGAQVTVDETLRSSPSVVGRLRGKAPGATFQLAGHMDHIDVPHRPPAREEDRICARGAADMKAGLASILEVVRTLHETGCDFPGELLVTAYGLHEAPVGDGAGLRKLIEKGIVGDAALVAEGPNDVAVVMGKGQAIWTIRIVRPGQTRHELVRDRASPDLFEAAAAVISALRAEATGLAERDHCYPLLGPESLFLGQLHCGDFYNRVPTECCFQGTRRWLPDRSFDKVRTAFDRFVADLSLPVGIEAMVDWIPVGESYEIDPDECVIRALRSSFRELHGGEPPLGGMSSVCDTSRLVPLGGVPTAVWGVDGATAHADFEYVKLDRLVPACRMHLLTTLEYLRRQAQTREE